MRLAYLARNRGDFKRALEYIEEAKKNHNKLVKPINQCCIRGKILTDLSELDKAYEEFRYVLEHLSKDDSYAIIGMANINYEHSTRCREDPK